MLANVLEDRLSHTGVARCIGTSFLESNFVKDSEDLKRHIYSDVTLFLGHSQAPQFLQIFLALSIMALARWVGTTCVGIFFRH